MTNFSSFQFLSIIERLGLRSWRRALESTRCIVGLLNKVQLCLSGCLTKEYCIGIYIVAKWIRMMSRKAGLLSTALYLKCCAVALMRVRAGSFELHMPLPHPISLTRGDRQ